MNQIKHIGVYGIIIKNNKILLIKKCGGPYDGFLDLPGGTIEFKERPIEALKRELKEETGINIKNYELFDVDSVNVEFLHHNEIENIHHIGIFYKITDYSGNIESDINITCINDDSRGAEYFDIEKLDKNKLSKIVLLELNKL